MTWLNYLRRFQRKWNSSFYRELQTVKSMDPGFNFINTGKSPVFVMGILILSMVLSGCNQSFERFKPSRPPSPLPSFPAQPVISNPLPPTVDYDGQETDQQLAGPSTISGERPLNPDELLPGETTSTASSVKITREGMAGSWRVPSDGPECRIILAFTKWSGGYRAATRRCASAEIQSVNAWDVKDQSVVLVNQSGNIVARLFGVEGGHYNGRTRYGDPVSFVR